MRTITKTAIIIRFVFLICIVSAGLIASFIEDSRATESVATQQVQEVATVVNQTSEK